MSLYSEVMIMHTYMNNPKSSHLKDSCQIHK